MMSFEVWLPVGAFALYLFDSIQWLYSNELLFLRGARRWSFAQSGPLVVAGHRLYLPNPLTPGIAVFKVRWSESDPRRQQEDQAQLECFLRALRPVKYLVGTLLALLLALPIVLLLYGTGVQLLAVMAGFYGVILVALGYIFTQRQVLRLTSRAFANLCFDCLACAPFAVNLVRKLALRRALAGNPIAFAGESFEPVEFDRLIDAVAARVTAQLAHEHDLTARRQELGEFREKLKAMRRA
jgi:hypothetical protein